MSSVHLTHDQATAVIQNFFEGRRPEKDMVLDRALALKGLTLEAIEKWRKAARKVTRGKPRFCVCTPTGSGKNRLKPISVIPLSPRG